MSKYKYTPNCREISGFGGGYEKTCQDMIIAGMEWIGKHKKSKLNFSEYENVTGFISAENKDSKKLEDYITKDRDCTGAMVHKCIQHILKATEVGWEEYIRLMEEKN